MGSSDGTGQLTTEELFRQHAGFVARFLTRLGVPPELRQDALQEVFLVVHRNGGYRPGLAKPTSYLASIALRAAAHHRHRQGKARSRHSEAPVEQMASEREDPASALQVRQDLQRLQQALERLPEDLSTTLILVELEGESCVSVASGLGCPVGTIYWRLHQARKQLQSALAALDSPRRTMQPARERAPAARPVRLATMLFALDGSSRSEASRLIRLAREQPSPQLPLEQLLTRHQQLIAAGGEPPAWSSGCVPHAASWAALVGAGPIAVGVIATASILAALLLAPHRVPAPLSALRRAEQSAPRLLAAGLAPVPATATPTTLTATAPSPVSADPQAVRANPTRDRAKESARLRGGTREGNALRAPAQVASATTATAKPADLQEPARPVERPPQPQPQPQPQAAQRAAPQKSHAASDAELAEMRDITEAERLLSDDPKAALALTHTMQASFPEGYFHEERAYLEVMALSQLGRAGEVREKAAAFLHKYPAGLYSNRVRRAAAGKAD